MTVYIVTKTEDNYGTFVVQAFKTFETARALLEFNRDRLLGEGYSVVPGFNVPETAPNPKDGRSFETLSMYRSPGKTVKYTVWAEKLV